MIFDIFDRGGGGDFEKVKKNFEFLMLRKNFMVTIFSDKFSYIRSTMDSDNVKEPALSLKPLRAQLQGPVGIRLARLTHGFIAPRSLLSTVTTTIVADAFNLGNARFKSQR